MSEPRVSDPCLWRLEQGHVSLKVRGAGPWDGVDVIPIVRDLIDARARIAELEAQADAYRAQIANLEIWLERAMALSEEEPR